VRKHQRKTCCANFVLIEDFIGYLRKNYLNSLLLLSLLFFSFQLFKYDFLTFTYLINILTQIIKQIQIDVVLIV